MNLTPITNQWTPASWQVFPARQLPEYDDHEGLLAVYKLLGQMPPLVSVSEVKHLKNQLKLVAEGKAFLLQGGDCAEKFADARKESVAKQMRLLWQMAALLHYDLKCPIIVVGRLAGQYAKPRSSSYEQTEGMTFSTFRGDAVNAVEKNFAKRLPKPERLLMAYYFSQKTLRSMRKIYEQKKLLIPQLGAFRVKSSSSSGFEDLVLHFKKILSQSFKQGENWQNGWEHIFTSHEALLLGFEQALTHWIEEEQGFYNLSAHFLWLGDRTRHLDGAHVEYLRGIQNPIGIKVGPKCSADDLVALCRHLDPMGTPGKITLITRLGSDLVSQVLPNLIKGVQTAGINSVIWAVDPMHGNSERIESDLKTRHFDKILKEIRQTAILHRQSNSRLSGLHLELSGDAVTECLGGRENISLHELGRNYTTSCDPRLNYGQSLEMIYQLCLEKILGQSPP